MKYFFHIALVVLLGILFYSMASLTCELCGTSLPDMIIELHASETAKRIKVKAQECADAVVTGDYKSLAAFTHPRIIEMMGGREKMIEHLMQDSAQMSSDGCKFVSATVGHPEEPRMVGTLMISMIPEKLVLRAQGATLTQEGSLLGISDDKGTTWHFLDVSNTSEFQLNEMFPELAGNVTIPRKKMPIRE